MSSETKVELPKFLNYDEEKTNCGYEAIIDFFLSYILRCSQEKLKADYPTLYDYGRTTAYYLIHGENNIVNGVSGYRIGLIPDSFRVTNVKIERQPKKKIDILAEITVCDHGQPQTYILNIENKFYSELKDHQLREAHALVKENYKGVAIINLFITLERNDNFRKAINLCIENDYKYLTIGDITSYWEKGKTGNELFDTLWSEL